MLKKLQTTNQQPLVFGGRGRTGRVPSARTPSRSAAAAIADSLGPAPKRRGQAHHGAGDAVERMRSHSEASTPSKKCAPVPSCCPPSL